VVVDEPGYLAFAAGEAELVFRVISQRNGRASVIVMGEPPVRRMDYGVS
jgi:hypothetical protein